MNKADKKIIDDLLPSLNIGTGISGGRWFSPHHGQQGALGVLHSAKLTSWVLIFRADGKRFVAREYKVSRGGETDYNLTREARFDSLADAKKQSDDWRAIHARAAAAHRAKAKGKPRTPPRPPVNCRAVNSEDRAAESRAVASALARRFTNLASLNRNESDPAKLEAAMKLDLANLTGERLEISPAYEKEMRNALRRFRRFKSKIKSVEADVFISLNWCDGFCFKSHDFIAGKINSSPGATKKRVQRLNLPKIKTPGRPPNS